MMGRMSDGAEQVDVARIERAVREILVGIGEDPDREGLLDTPGRVARMFAETMAGLSEEPRDHLTTVFDADHDEMVMVRDVPFASTCEHHLVPFVGVAHVAYVPGASGMITGLSKLARLVDGYARRPQVQERLTVQIANAIDSVLAPKGVLVVIEAEHMCMTLRGVRATGSRTLTSAVHGLLRDDPRSRQEFFSLAGASHR